MRLRMPDRQLYSEYACATRTMLPTVSTGTATRPRGASPANSGATPDTIARLGPARRSRSSRRGASQIRSRGAGRWADSRALWPRAGSRGRRNSTNACRTRRDERMRQNRMTVVLTGGRRLTAGWTPIHCGTNAPGGTLEIPALLLAGRAEVGGRRDVGRVQRLLPLLDTAVVLLALVVTPLHPPGGVPARLLPPEQHPHKGNPGVVPGPPLSIEIARPPAPYGTQLVWK